MFSSGLRQEIVVDDKPSGPQQQTLLHKLSNNNHFKGDIPQN